MFDINWSDILKASGIQFAFVAGMAAVVLWIDRSGVSPIALDRTFTQIVFLIGALALALALASVVMTARASVATPIAMALKRRRAVRKHAEEFRKYIPFMPGEERKVIAQLLFEQHKSFVGDLDGGYAAPLIGRGFIQRNLARGQGYSADDVPYLIPDHIWDVATAHRDQFKYEPDPRGGDAWRVHWMAR